MTNKWDKKGDKVKVGEIKKLSSSFFKRSGKAEGGRIGLSTGTDIYKPSLADKKWSRYLGKKYKIKKLIKTPALKRSGKAEGGSAKGKK